MKQSIPTFIDLLRNVAARCATCVWTLLVYTHGNVSEDITMKDKDHELQDVHATIQYDNENISILCCPEDLVCCNIVKGPHTNKECCEACETPM